MPLPGVSVLQSSSCRNPLLLRQLQFQQATQVLQDSSSLITFTQAGEVTAARQQCPKQPAAQQAAQHVVESLSDVLQEAHGPDSNLEGEY